MRRGVSLIEVLMSIFILSVGVLGIGSMLTLGHRMSAEIDRHDAASACARACLARVVTSENLGNYQEFVRPSEPMFATFPITGWTSPDVGRFFYNGAYYPTTTQPNDTSGLNSPILIDPIGYARSAGTNFPPANASEPRQLLSNTTNPLTLAIPRVTPRTWGASNVRQAMPLALAERQFSWSDDVTLPVSDDGNRPRQLYQNDASGNPLVAQFTGAYTWAVMVTPADEMWNYTARMQSHFRAWVLVYQRREIGTADVPVERTVVCNVRGGGAAGGDVKLTTTVAPEYLDIKRDQWIMLCGVDALRRARCEWYRIRTIDRETVQEATGRWAVHATLAGPDWKCYDAANPNVDHWCDRQKDTADTSKFINTPFDLDGDGNASDVLAVIADGLVSVWQGDGRYIEIPRY